MVSRRDHADAKCWRVNSLFSMLETSSTWMKYFSSMTVWSKGSNTFAISIALHLSLERDAPKGPGKRGHTVAHDVSWAAKTRKHLLLTRKVSEQNQKHFLRLRHKICVRNKCCACGQTGKHLCRQQCVRNNMFSFARPLIDHFRYIYIYI